MTALVFRPCDYAQFWDSDTGYIYTLDNHRLQEEHAGAAAAVDCPWFTNNNAKFWNASDLRNNGFEVIDDDLESVRPYVARVATGIFTGTYTVDEEDLYVYGGSAAWLWLMCIPPVCAYCWLFWLIATHEKVNCCNKEKTRDYFEDLAEEKGMTAEDAMGMVANNADDASMKHAAKTMKDEEEENSGGNRTEQSVDLGRAYPQAEQVPTRDVEMATSK